MRLLFLMIIIFIFWLTIKLISRLGLLFFLNIFNLKKLLATLLNPRENNNNNTSNSAPTSTKMVKCATCQLYIPEHQAYQFQGKYYCCKEHAK